MLSIIFGYIYNSEYCLMFLFLLCYSDNKRFQNNRPIDPAEEWEMIFDRNEAAIVRFDVLNRLNVTAHF